MKKASSPDSGTTTIEDSFRTLQDDICRGLQALDPSSWHEDPWQYDRGSGGGRTRVLEFGDVFEKAGVNFSAIGGDQLPKAALAQLDFDHDVPFFATGVSLVIHPKNPHIPTIHMNVRYFEAGHNRERWWFGGGIDLTPYYPVRAQAVQFHRALKQTCDRFDADWYPDFKARCDDYFYLPHRGETRGIGGIFFDHMQHDRHQALAFACAVGETFLPAYVPIVEANRDTPWTEEQRRFQLYRRGRYVEFNLLFDRGTRFGIESDGRTESILMSLPPQANWLYDYQPEPGSAEAELTAQYLKPQDWV